MNWQQEGLLALRVLLAGVLGAVVGWQREHLGIEAGVRTFAAVSLGACVFGLIYPSDTRIAAQVVTGIGFLGAGVIMRGRMHIHGLTTAASLWAVASIGLAVAYGRIILSLSVTIILFILLAIPLKKWEREKGLIENRKPGA
ncbi:MAG TPA: MgtC/SapB family protein [Bryobacteraceae bacterium]|nr:MgtC/SapB family protein [Bryobacteraceae bacterium]